MTETLATRACPYCKEDVRGDASRCRWCAADIVPTEPDHGGVCPFCKEDVKPEAVRCRHCQADIGPATRSMPAGRGGGGCGCGTRTTARQRLRAVPRSSVRSAANREGPSADCNHYEIDDEGIWIFVWETADTCVYWGPY